MGKGGKDEVRRKRFTEEQIIRLMREANQLRSQGLQMTEVCRQLDISQASLHRWKERYGNMEVNQLRKLKTLESENTRLKKLVADLSLDKAMLEEVNRGNF